MSGSGNQIGTGLSAFEQAMALFAGDDPNTNQKEAKDSKDSGASSSNSDQNKKGFSKASAKDATSKKLAADGKGFSQPAVLKVQGPPGPEAKKIYLQLSQKYKIGTEHFDKDKNGKISDQEVFAYVTRHIDQEFVQLALVKSGVLPKEFIEGPVLEENFVAQVEQVGFGPKLAAFHSYQAEQAKDLNEKQRQLEIAVRYEPDSVYNQIDLGEHYSSTQQKAKAKKTLKRAVMLGHNTSHGLRASAPYQVKEHKENLARERESLENELKQFQALSQGEGILNAYKIIKNWQEVETKALALSKALKAARGFRNHDALVDFAWDKYPKFLVTLETSADVLAKLELFRKQYEAAQEEPLESTHLGLGAAIPGQTKSQTHRYGIPLKNEASNFLSKDLSQQSETLARDTLIELRSQHEARLNQQTKRKDILGAIKSLENIIRLDRKLKDYGHWKSSVSHYYELLEGVKKNKTLSSVELFEPYAKLLGHLYYLRRDWRWSPDQGSDISLGKSREQLESVVETMYHGYFEEFEELFPEFKYHGVSDLNSVMSDLISRAQKEERAVKALSSLKKTKEYLAKYFKLQKENPDLINQAQSYAWNHQNVSRLQVLQAQGQLYLKALRNAVDLGNSVHINDILEELDTIIKANWNKKTDQEQLSFRMAAFETLKEINEIFKGTGLYQEYQRIEKTTWYAKQLQISAQHAQWNPKIMSSLESVHDFYSRLARNDSEAGKLSKDLARYRANWSDDLQGWLDSYQATYPDALSAEHSLISKNEIHDKLKQADQLSRASLNQARSKHKLKDYEKRALLKDVGVRIEMVGSVYGLSVAERWEQISQAGIDYVGLLDLTKSRKGNPALLNKSDLRPIRAKLEELIEFSLKEYLYSQGLHDEFYLEVLEPRIQMALDHGDSKYLNNLRPEVLQSYLQQREVIAELGESEDESQQMAALGLASQAGDKEGMEAALAPLKQQAKDLPPDQQNQAYLKLIEIYATSNRSDAQVEILKLVQKIEANDPSRGAGIQTCQQEVIEVGEDGNPITRIETHQCDGELLHEQALYAWAYYHYRAGREDEALEKLADIEKHPKGQALRDQILEQRKSSRSQEVQEILRALMAEETGDRVKEARSWGSEGLAGYYEQWLYEDTVKLKKYIEEGMSPQEALIKLKGERRVRKVMKEGVYQRTTQYLDKRDNALATERHLRGLDLELGHQLLEDNYYAAAGTLASMLQSDVTPEIRKMAKELGELVQSDAKWDTIGNAIKDMLVDMFTDPVELTITAASILSGLWVVRVAKAGKMAYRAAQAADKAQAVIKKTAQLQKMLKGLDKVKEVKQIARAADKLRDVKKAKVVISQLEDLAKAARKAKDFQKAKQIEKVLSEVGEAKAFIKDAKRLAKLADKTEDTLELADLRRLAGEGVQDAKRLLTKWDKFALFFGYEAGVDTAVEVGLRSLLTDEEDLFKPINLAKRYMTTVLVQGSIQGTLKGTNKLERAWRKPLGQSTWKRVAFKAGQGSAVTVATATATKLSEDLGLQPEQTIPLWARLFQAGLQGQQTKILGKAAHKLQSYLESKGIRRNIKKQVKALGFEGKEAKQMINILFRGAMDHLNKNDQLAHESGKDVEDARILATVQLKAGLKAIGEQSSSIRNALSSTADQLGLTGRVRRAYLRLVLSTGMEWRSKNIAKFIQGYEKSLSQRMESLLGEAKKQDGEARQELVWLLWVSGHLKQDVKAWARRTGGIEAESKGALVLLQAQVDSLLPLVPQEAGVTFAVTRWLLIRGLDEAGIQQLHRDLKAERIEFIYEDGELKLVETSKPRDPDDSSPPDDGTPPSSESGGVKALFDESGGGRQGSRDTQDTVNIKRPETQEQDTGKTEVIVDDSSPSLPNKTRTKGDTWGAIDPLMVVFTKVAEPVELNSYLQSAEGNKALEPFLNREKLKAWLVAEKGLSAEEAQVIYRDMDQLEKDLAALNQAVQEYKNQDPIVREQSLGFQEGIKISEAFIESVQPVLQSIRASWFYRMSKEFAEAQKIILKRHKTNIEIMQSLTIRAEENFSFSFHSRSLWDLREFVDPRRPNAYQMLSAENYGLLDIKITVRDWNRVRQALHSESNEVRHTAFKDSQKLKLARYLIHEQKFSLEEIGKLYGEEWVLKNFGEFYDRFPVEHEVDVVLIDGKLFTPNWREGTLTPKDYSTSESQEATGKRDEALAEPSIFSRAIQAAGAWFSQPRTRRGAILGTILGIISNPTNAEASVTFAQAVGSKGLAGAAVGALVFGLSSVLGLGSRKSRQNPKPNLPKPPVESSTPENRLLAKPGMPLSLFAKTQNYFSKLPERNQTEINAKLAKLKARLVIEQNPAMMAWLKNKIKQLEAKTSTSMIDRLNRMGELLAGDSPPPETNLRYQGPSPIRHVSIASAENTNVGIIRGPTELAYRGPSGLPAAVSLASIHTVTSPQLEKSSGNGAGKKPTPTSRTPSHLSPALKEGPIKPSELPWWVALHPEIRRTIIESSSEQAQRQMIRALHLAKQKSLTLDDLFQKEITDHALGKDLKAINQIFDEIDRGFDLIRASLENTPDILTSPAYRGLAQAYGMARRRAFIQILRGEISLDQARQFAQDLREGRLYLRPLAPDEKSSSFYPLKIEDVYIGIKKEFLADNGLQREALSYLKRDQKNPDPNLVIMADKHQAKLKKAIEENPNDLTQAKEILEKYHQKRRVYLEARYSKKILDNDRSENSPLKELADDYFNQLSPQGREGRFKRKDILLLQKYKTARAEKLKKKVSSRSAIETSTPLPAQAEASKPSKKSQDSKNSPLPLPFAGGPMAIFLNPFIMKTVERVGNYVLGWWTSRTNQISPENPPAPITARPVTAKPDPDKTKDSNSTRTLDPAKQQRRQKRKQLRKKRKTKNGRDKITARKKTKSKSKAKAQSAQAVTPKTLIEVSASRHPAEIFSQWASRGLPELPIRAVDAEGKIIFEIVRIGHLAYHSSEFLTPDQIKALKKSGIKNIELVASVENYPLLALKPWTQQTEINVKATDGEGNLIWEIKNGVLQSLPPKTTTALLAQAQGQSPGNRVAKLKPLNKNATVALDPSITLLQKAAALDLADLSGIPVVLLDHWMVGATKFCSNTMVAVAKKRRMRRASASDYKELEDMRGPFAQGFNGQNNGWLKAYKKMKAWLKTNGDHKSILEEIIRYIRLDDPKGSTYRDNAYELARFFAEAKLDEIAPALKRVREFYSKADGNNRLSIHGAILGSFLDNGRRNGGGQAERNTLVRLVQEAEVSGNQLTSIRVNPRDSHLDQATPDITLVQEKNGARTTTIIEVKSFSEIFNKSGFKDALQRGSGGRRRPQNPALKVAAGIGYGLYQLTQSRGASNADALVLEVDVRNGSISKEVRQALQEQITDLNNPRLAIHLRYSNQTTEVISMQSAS